MTLLLTGFEPFLDVAVNPSGEIARLLDGAVVGGVPVVGRVLPVSFGTAPQAVQDAADGLGGPPVAVVSLGVHRGPEFRLEQRAGCRYASAQPDNDGVTGADVHFEGPEWLETPVDLGLCAAWLEAAGAPSTMVSSDAGGYLCERVFRAGLEVVGAPALFIHVPPVEQLTVREQAEVIHGFLARLVGHLTAGTP